ncbi:MAG TPA: glycoside hydrolase family 9 protein [Longimicrobiales bacterium]|nr:glycoside hydrolase family 9 protein [Longimicrobiales bacterium]
MRSSRKLHLILIAAALVTTRAAAAQHPDSVFIRINQLGYLPEAPKIAIACALNDIRVESFALIDMRGRRVYGPKRATTSEPFGPCRQTARLDFSDYKREGDVLIVTRGIASPVVHISKTTYRGAADTLLAYMREQRSGWNPLFRDSVHRNDGIVVDHARAGEMIKASGGWADAADYLQYVSTSAYATFIMLMAQRDHPRAVSDRFLANGLPGSNSQSDMLDEARHGLEWLLRMFPSRDLMFNQLADDRDHSFWDLPVNDTSDYGWGKGGPRPLYPCTGQPQGLFKYKNRATGKASTAGKYAAAFALGARMFAQRDPEFAQKLTLKAKEAYDVGLESPGVCQTAPGRSPYFYEEDNWADDMELAAAELYALTDARGYLNDAMRFADMEPVTPWMGRDTANHYQWFPWHNNGHYETWRNANPTQRAKLAAMYRDGLQRVVARSSNGFRVGVPFIWCSNNLMASFATQAHLYRKMTGDSRFIEYEFAALDWLFGANPWGVSMIIDFPAGARTIRNPHSVIADKMGVWTQRGGMVDGPVYRSIFGNLAGIRLLQPDEYAALNGGFIVYHDDLGDYSTNEPIMDGTANLTYLLSALAR